LRISAQSVLDQQGERLGSLFQARRSDPNARGRAEGERSTASQQTSRES
jgi:hypothetical protein